MAGNSRGYFGGTDASELARLTREAQEKAREQEFEAELAALLRDELTEFNNRDTETIRSILDDITEGIEDAIEDSVQLLFGGSIAKNTYLNGLSDVDCLALLDESFSADSPSELRRQFAEALKRRFGADKVWVGALAVTVEEQGHTIQLLPALRSGPGFHIGSPDGDDWSQINPQRFAEKLRDANNDLGGKLVPAIKLAKGVLATLPDGLRPSGYHIESMAINVFKGYRGQLRHQDMLRHFFQEAPRHVLQPVRDSTGQSVHVDDALGHADSPQRQSISRALDRINKRIKNADSAPSLPMWRGILGKETE